MKKTKSKSKKRQYFGASKAKPLVERLNNPVAAGDIRDVLTLMSIHEDLRSSRDRSERVRLTGKANDILSNLRFYPLIIVDAKGRWRTLWQAEEHNSTGDSVHRWLELLERGLVSQLKRCGYCRQFFFAKFPHNNYDTVECRDKAAKQDPERQELRRAYERQYYQDKRREQRKSWRKK